MELKHNQCLSIIMDLLREHSNENKKLGIQDIQRKIEQEWELNVGRRTITRAMRVLRERYGQDEEGAWIEEGIRLHYTEIPRRTGNIYTEYWVEEYREPLFSDEELFLLIETILFSKQVSKKDAEEIAGKLKSLSENPHSAVFDVVQEAPRNYHTRDREIFWKIGQIYEAIRADRRICFSRMRVGTNGKMVRTAEERMSVSPYSVVFVEGTFVLLGGVENSKVIQSFRIDHMADLSMVKDQRRTFVPGAAKLIADPGSYIHEHPYMHPGKSIQMRLLLQHTSLGDFVDTFGTNFRVCEASSEEAAGEKNSSIIEICCNLKDMCEWILRHIGQATVLAPEKVREYLTHLCWNSSMVFGRGLNGREGPEEYYQKAIKAAKNTGLLRLYFIDLKEYHSYQQLTEVTHARFLCNYLSDFQFLENWKDLRSLSIEANPVMDFTFLGKLERLNRLELRYTNVTDLDFLAQIPWLRELRLCEPFLENMEGVCHLKRLKRLILPESLRGWMDPEHLRRVCGAGLEVEWE